MISGIIKSIKLNQEYRCIASIDPGKNGGITFISTLYRNFWSYPMPTIKIKTKSEQTVFKRDSKGNKILIKSGPNKGQFKKTIKTPAKYRIELDTVQINKLFKDYNVEVLVIERIGRTIGNSSASSTTVATNYGKLLCIAELLNIPIVSVAPNKWKKDLSLPSDKEPTIEFVEKLTLKSFRTTRGKLLDGQADSFSIGYWYLTKKGINNGNI